MTWAPHRTSAAAVVLPMPVLHPVMMTVVLATLSSWVGVQVDMTSAVVDHLCNEAMLVVLCFVLFLWSVVWVWVCLSMPME